MEYKRLTIVTQQQSSMLANMHLKYLPESFLTKLGLPFLKFFYQNISLHKDNYLCCCFDNNEIVGYIVGNKFPDTFLTPILSFRSLIIVAVRFFKHPIALFSAFYIILKSFNKQPRQFPEIYFLCVAENYTHKHIGTTLINFFEKWLSANSKNTYIVGTYLDNQESQAFYIKLGYLVYMSKSQFGKPFVYYKKTLC